MHVHQMGGPGASLVQQCLWEKEGRGAASAAGRVSRELMPAAVQWFGPRCPNGPQGAILLPLPVHGSGQLCAFPG